MYLPLQTINPSYAARIEQVAQPLYAKLPRAPQNASPVPGLTSLYHNHRAGDYGDRSYPGNCGGQLIKDLLNYFQSETVFDPMSGSGTCQDVCRDLQVECVSADIRIGIDASNPAKMPRTSKFDFVWIHPPYYRQKVYTNDPRDLSQAPTLELFLERYERVIQNCANVLAPNGKLVILMGDYVDRQYGFLPLTYYTKQLAFAAGLKQHCTDIIRFSHGASSSHKVYRSTFIPGLHDTCMIFERNQS